MSLLLLPLLVLALVVMYVLIGLKSVHFPLDDLFGLPAYRITQLLRCQLVLPDPKGG